jgi:hypothetical protein
MSEAEARGMVICPLCAEPCWPTMESHYIVEDRDGNRMAAHKRCAEALLASQQG